MKKYKEFMNLKLTDKIQKKAKIHFENSQNPSQFSQNDMKSKIENSSASVTPNKSSLKIVGFDKLT